MKTRKEALAMCGYIGAELVNELYDELELMSKMSSYMKWLAMPWYKKIYLLWSNKIDKDYLNNINMSCYNIAHTTTHKDKLWR